MFDNANRNYTVLRNLQSNSFDTQLVEEGSFKLSYKRLFFFPI